MIHALLASSTLAKSCEIFYQYNYMASTTSYQLATTTQNCYNPATAFSVLGIIVVAFLIIIFGVVKVFK